MAKKKTAQKNELQTRTFLTDVTDVFDPAKDDLEFTLTSLKKAVDDLISVHGEEADIMAELEGDDYYASWTWTISTTRLETAEEQKERIKKEKEREKLQKQRAAREEKQERKEYLRLKKKFEGK